MYYIYGSVRTIPTYRVYRLYDNIVSRLYVHVTVATYLANVDHELVQHGTTRPGHSHICNTLQKAQSR